MTKFIYPKSIWFRYVELSLTKNVFIPRPETELIIENIEQGFNDKQVLDIFSGSGAIGCSILKEFKPKTVHFVEISKEVIPVLTANVSKYDSQNKTEIYNQDAIEFLKETINNYDIILANPPYIPYSWETKINVVDPKLALFSDILPYQTIEFAYQKLKKGGELIIEHFDYDQEKIEECFKENGYKNIQRFLDLACKPRFVKGTK